MRIIKEGRIEKLKKIRRFDCKKCGCIFEADNTEYKDVSTQREGPCFMIACPYCKQGVYNNDPY